MTAFLLWFGAYLLAAIMVALIIRKAMTNR